ncbi:hypothetical protein [Rossellomorea marisflavi]|uniref:hypothetical protein n=1 Tax=Rossellomorea marisflavi TaxID=189381 RepID=UPI0009A688C0|nr:hypothetical protein [Rossellomorea marisflavi]
MTKSYIDPQAIADDLIRHLDEWYSLPEVWDNELDRQIHEWYADPPQVWPKRPYFSPSSADADPRELYYKQLRSQKDVERKQPHQGRWTHLGTLVGDMIQRTVLAMERNMKKKAAFPSRFRFLRTKDGRPMFEDFAKKNVRVTHGGRTFYLYGTCDGIMEYAHPETGEILRVGLEVKSKQTTSAKTSLYSMREPEEKHKKQCFVYGEMYEVDYYIILYVNTAKKSWEVDEEDYQKSPDIRAFGFEITQEDKDEVFDYFVSVLDAVNDMSPPPLKPDKWTFNNFKSIIALEMTEDEIDEVRRLKNRAIRSRLPDYKKRSYADCLHDILAIRDERKRRANG